MREREREREWQRWRRRQDEIERRFTGSDKPECIELTSRVPLSLRRRCCEATKVSLSDFISRNRVSVEGSGGNVGYFAHHFG